MSPTPTPRQSSGRAIASIPAGDKNAEFRAARTRREFALARRAEIELAQLEGSVVDVDDVRAGIVNKFTIVKTHLLGIPSRMRQRDPTLTAAQITLFDDLIREASPNWPTTRCRRCRLKTTNPRRNHDARDREFHDRCDIADAGTATKAGDFCRDHGYPPPTEEQTAQMSAPVAQRIHGVRHEPRHARSRTDGSRAESGRRSRRGCG